MTVGHSGTMNSPWSAGIGAPAFPERRARWSTMIFGAGCAAMLISLAMVLGGVPAKLFYDADASGRVNKNTSHDMLKMSQSIDNNMKYIKENSGYGPNQYNGYLTSISHSENAVPVMAQSVTDMTVDVDKMDDSLAAVAKTTVTMQGDMQAMADVSGSSASTMSGLQGDVSGMGASMKSLFDATKNLTDKMAGIEAKAKGIADHGTSKALKGTKELNDALPDKVPAPQTVGLPVAPRGIV